ncbi:30S ribosomal protein S6 [Kovacikia minuta CCNUW1]|uniref:30S ribosomal protein S6 n=1 Tax=Kovacikia minuta TaxID=2931930 RepID=UPI001CCA236A|nr:30S ribosomal protein S6 [Kovacikia minuta]UBF24557.1 30S ribosomal protein S6 [Kovacikia minuta CCNUW1]
MAVVNLYETMYILRPDLGEEVVDQAIEKYQSILRDNGATILETQHRGKRRLAYEIQKHREGIYIQMNYQADGSQIAMMERAMRLSDEVIRFLTVQQEVPKASATADIA